jgi:hypothetical protein
MGGQHSDNSYSNKSRHASRWRRNKSENWDRGGARAHQVQRVVLSGIPTVRIVRDKDVRNAGRKIGKTFDRCGYGRFVAVMGKVTYTNVSHSQKEEHNIA